MLLEWFRTLAGASLAVLLLSAGPLPQVFAAEAAPDKNTFAAVLDPWLQTTRFTGAVLVAAGGEVSLRKTFGLADHAWDIPNTPDTRYPLGALTNTFKAALVLQLIEEQQLSLNATLADLWPAFPGAFRTRVNLEHLLTQRSGLPPLVELSDPGRLTALADQPLRFTPGTGYEYSSANYALVGRILERVGERPLARMLVDRILSPLKMADSGVTNAGETVKRRANCYRRADDGSLRNHNATAATGAEVYSTLDDLLLWSRGLSGRYLLSDESRARMFNAQAPMAWTVGTTTLSAASAPVTVATYDGESGGCRAVITRLPTRNATIIVLNNNGVPYGAIAKLTFELARQLQRAGNG